MDPIHNINFKKDSSLAMLWGRPRPRLADILHGTTTPLCRARCCMGLMAPLSVMRDAHHFYELDEQHVSPLGDLDVILMRKDPPFDSQFLHTTYLLSPS